MAMGKATACILTAALTLGAVGGAALLFRTKMRAILDEEFNRLYLLAANRAKPADITHEQAAKSIDLARTRLVAEESARFVIRNMPLAPSLPDKLSLLKFSLGRVDPKLNGLHCEFGVGKGETVNFIANNTSAEIHGFDSFEGLPEDWRAEYKKGAFRVDRLPVVAPNVRLYKGMFHESLPGFLKEHPGPVAFAHLDADLYSSTRTVLELLDSRLVAGTILQFDEFFNYPGWEEGEYRAFHEYVSRKSIRFEYIGYVGANEQVAVRILGRGAGR